MALSVKRKHFNVKKPDPIKDVDTTDYEVRPILVINRLTDARTTGEDAKDEQNHKTDGFHPQFSFLFHTFLKNGAGANVPPLVNYFVFLL